MFVVESNFCLNYVKLVQFNSSIGKGVGVVTDLFSQDDIFGGEYLYTRCLCVWYSNQRGLVVNPVVKATQVAKVQHYDHATVMLFFKQYFCAYNPLKFCL